MVSGVPRWGCILIGPTVVTGAGGYLGSRLVEYLAASGVDVRPISRRPAPWLSVPPAIVDLQSERDALERAVDGAEAVIHLAGANQVLAVEQPDGALAQTAGSARGLAAACAATGVARIVYVSTVHVYGAALVPGAEVTERSLPQPRSTYALSRLVVEHLLAMAEPEAVVFRLTNGVGAPVTSRMTQWPLVANDLSRQAVAAGAMELRSDGQQYRDFVAIDDVCRVLAAALDPSRVPSGTYNFASGQAITIRTMAEMVQDAVERRTGRRPPLRTMAPKGPPTPGYTVRADALDALGLRAEVPVRAAVEQTVAFCVEHRDELDLEEQ